MIELANHVVKSSMWSSVIGHNAAVQYLTDIIPDLVPHALLFVGVDHCGKETMARTCAAALLGCDRARAETHPRIITLVAGVDEKTGKRRASIPVEAVRATRQLLSLTHAEPLIIMIPHAHELREESANALLKIMEEPHPNVYFFICARSDEAVLPTIKSRCAVIRLGTVSAEEIQAALVVRGTDAALAQESAQFSQGRPGVALTYVVDDALRARVAVERARFEKIIQAGGLHEAQPLIADLFGKKEEHLQSRAVLSEILEWWLLWLRERAPLHSAVPLIAHTIVELNENMHPRLLMERVVMQLTK